MPSHRKPAILPLFLYVFVGLALCLLPFVVGRYVITLAFLLWGSIALAESYNLVGGYLGYMNLGHAGFFGVSAYNFGILYTQGVPFPWA